ncbi:MAG TPA: GNAT family N-acetyltransferase [Actinomycetota bacterium]|nr:GNAT family N-acetyltransferase [Actinomycetota bacterium]
MNASVPPSFTIRPPTPEDLDAVTAVVAADELATDGVVDISADDIRSGWQRPSFDLANDAVLVLEGDRAVAYAEVAAWRAWVHVHPDVLGRGVGAALLAWTEGRARELGAQKLGQTKSDHAHAAIRLLTANGYGVRWTTWRFHYPLDDEPPTPELPDGITLRSVELGRDDRAVHGLIEATFSDWPDRDPGLSFEDWAASYLYREDFDPELTLLLEDGHELVGVSHCRVYGDEGWIEQLAVKRSHRGRGLGGALLRASFRRFFERGLRTAGLSTESRTGARGVYEHVGMRVSRSFKRYSKDL